MNNQYVKHALTCMCRALLLLLTIFQYGFSWSFDIRRGPEPGIRGFFDRFSGGLVDTFNPDVSSGYTLKTYSNSAAGYISNLLGYCTERYYIPGFTKAKYAVAPYGTHYPEGYKCYEAYVEPDVDGKGLGNHKGLYSVCLGDNEAPEWKEKLRPFDEVEQYIGPRRYLTAFCPKVPSGSRIKISNSPTSNVGVSSKSVSNKDEPLITASKVSGYISNLLGYCTERYYIPGFTEAKYAVAPYGTHYPEGYKCYEAYVEPDINGEGLGNQEALYSVCLGDKEAKGWQNKLNLLDKVEQYIKPRRWAVGLCPNAKVYYEGERYKYVRTPYGGACPDGYKLLLANVPPDPENLCFGNKMRLGSLCFSDTKKYSNSESFDKMVDRCFSTNYWVYDTRERYNSSNRLSLGNQKEDEQRKAPGNNGHVVNGDNQVSNPTGAPDVSNVGTIPSVTPATGSSWYAPAVYLSAIALPIVLAITAPYLKRLIERVKTFFMGSEDDLCDRYANEEGQKMELLPVLFMN